MHSITVSNLPNRLFLFLQHAKALDYWTWLLQACSNLKIQRVQICFFGQQSNSWQHSAANCLVQNCVRTLLAPSDDSPRMELKYRMLLHVTIAEYDSNDRTRRIQLLNAFIWTMVQKELHLCINSSMSGTCFFIFTRVRYIDDTSQLLPFIQLTTVHLLWKNIPTPNWRSGPEPQSFSFREIMSLIPSKLRIIHTYSKTII